MRKTTLLTMLLAAPGAVCLRADFSYDQTSKITGGALVSMMRMAGAFSKDARKAGEPIVSTTAIQGNRMLHKTADSAEIIDLDSQTITRVHFADRTYSVITFEQMKQAMEDMSKKMQSKTGDGDMQFDVSMKDTGQTRKISGNDAHEVVMTITAKGKDTKSGATGGIDVITDMWIAPKVSGYDEVRAFHRKMAQKLNWTPGGNPILGRPDMAKAMAQMYQEGAKMDGMPVLEVIKMGGSMEGVPQGTEAQPARQERQAPPPQSVSDAVGGALAGRLGIGGFGRKKPKQDQPQADDMPAGTATASPSGSNSGSASGSLMEMTVEVTSYSAAPADSSLFAVPAGFSKVDEEAIPQGRARRKK